MQDVDPTLTAALQQSKYAHSELLLFDLPSGLWGFWRGIGPLVIGGVTYVGAGSLLEMQQLDFGVELAASAIALKLRAVPETSLTPDILATIDDEDYKGRAVFIDFAYFDRETGILMQTLRQWRGYIDTIEHTGTIGSDYALIGRLEPRSLDHSRTGTRVRGDTDQRLFDAADPFFEHAAKTPTEVLPYGRGSTAASTDPARAGIAAGRGG